MRRAALALILVCLAACSRAPRSASFFAAHPEDAARVAADCTDGRRGGEECVNALAGERARVDAARLELYRRAFQAAP